MWVFESHFTHLTLKLKLKQNVFGPKRKTPTRPVKSVLSETKTENENLVIAAFND